MGHARGTPSKVAAILIGRSAIAAAAFEDMAALAARLRERGDIGTAVYAFTEQGTPSLRDAIRQLRMGGFAELLLLPMLVPMEPSFRAWLARALARWRTEDPQGWPIVRLAPPPIFSAKLGELVNLMMDAARASEPVVLPVADPAEADVIPAEKYRVLICTGGPCNNAGATALWGHFRNEQVRRGLRKAGQGTMSAKTSCLGPCKLAPVVQVWPEGIYYCGVDEMGIDRIIERHLMAGEVVHELAYAPIAGKQKLRTPPR